MREGRRCRRDATKINGYVNKTVAWIVALRRTKVHSERFGNIACNAVIGGDYPRFRDEHCGAETVGILQVADKWKGVC